MGGQSTPAPRSVFLTKHPASSSLSLELVPSQQQGVSSSGIGDEASGRSSLPGDRAKVSVWGYGLTVGSHCRLFGALMINFLKTAIYWVALQGFCPH